MFSFLHRFIKQGLCKNKYVCLANQNVQLAPDFSKFAHCDISVLLFVVHIETISSLVGKLQPDDTVLVHAGASGVGTAAVQLITRAGATAIVTAGSQEKIDFAKSLGAKHGFNYKEGSFKDKVMQATNGKLSEVILLEVFIFLKLIFVEKAAFVLKQFVNLTNVFYL